MQRRWRRVLRHLSHLRSDHSQDPTSQDTKATVPPQALASRKNFIRQIATDAVSWLHTQSHQKEVTEHARWRKSRAQLDMPGQYLGWALEDRIDVTLLCM
jgi:hypothetical protein